MPMPAPVRLLFAGVGSPGEAARCGAGGAWARAAVTKMGRAGLHGCGPHREPRVIGQDLHVAAENLVLTRVSQVVAGLGAGCDPVGAHQGGVQARKRLTSALEPVRDVGDVGGSLGDDLQGLVRVAVAVARGTPASRVRARVSVPSLGRRSTRAVWTRVVAVR